MDQDDKNTFDKHLSDIEDRYRGKKRKKHHNKVAHGETLLNSSAYFAFRAGTDLVSAFLVAVPIGWGLDHYFGSHGICLSVFTFLGGCAGVLNVIRLVMSKEKQSERENSGR